MNRHEFNPADEGLTEYRVTLREYGVLLYFDCWAEDEDHAVEQAADMYYNISVLRVEKK